MNGGLIHDWVGAVYIPGASIDQVLAMVQAYDRHKNIYQPDVIDSRLISRSGNDFHLSLRMVKHKLITVVLDTEHSVHYERLTATRWWSKSISTRIAQVVNPGKPGEKLLPPGHDHGFLWRLNTYWTFQQLDGGTYVECEAISLARDIPTGLGPFLGPIIRELPKQSLDNTLLSTRIGAISAGKLQTASKPSAN